MREMTILTRTGTAMLALMAGLYAVPVQAQAAPEQRAAAGEDIVITGSRIRRNPLDQDKPVVTVDEAAIAKTGLTAIADVLQRLPSSGGGLNTKGQQRRQHRRSARRDGRKFRLGRNRLALSRRETHAGARRRFALRQRSAAGGIPASVDLNELPVNLVERVEVLQSGASPLYGSDAIAGVVNIITKQSQKGLRASGQFGTYRQGDGRTYKATST